IEESVALEATRATLAEIYVLRARGIDIGVPRVAGEFGGRNWIGRGDVAEDLSGVHAPHGSQRNRPEAAELWIVDAKDPQLVPLIIGEPAVRLQAIERRPPPLRKVLIDWAAAGGIRAFPNKRTVVAKLQRVVTADLNISAESVTRLERHTLVLARVIA